MTSHYGLLDEYDPVFTRFYGFSIKAFDSLPIDLDLFEALNIRASLTIDWRLEDTLSREYQYRYRVNEFTKSVLQGREQVIITDYNGINLKPLLQRGKSLRPYGSIEEPGAET